MICFVIQKKLQSLSQEKQRKQRSLNNEDAGEFAPQRLIYSIKG